MNVPLANETRNGLLSSDDYRKLRGDGDSSSDKQYYFAPDEITGYYEPSESIDTSTLSNSRDTTTLQDLYDLYDELVNNNPGYYHSHLYGNDESGQYPIYKHSLIPQDIESHLDKKLPKLTFVTGTHGAEKNAIFSAYYLIKDICENWQSNPALEYLRWNVEIEFIPCVNPWAFDNGAGRKNSRGVDINRNFPEGWSLNPDPESTTYGGTEPFSEVESQYVKSFIDEMASQPNTIFFGDYHNHFAQDQSLWLWHALIREDTKNEPLEIATKHIMRKMTTKLSQNYGFDYHESGLGYMSYAWQNGKVREYASAQGIPSLVFECFSRLDDSTGLPQSLQASTEYTGNWFLTLIKTFKGYY